MTISVSITNIVNIAYAHSAIYNHLGTKPAILTDRQDKALRVLAYHTLCRLFPTLVGIVQPVSLIDDPETEDVVIFESAMHNGETVSSCLRPYLESILVSMLMQAIWHEVPEVADTYKSIIDSDIRKFKETFAPFCRIKPG